MRRRHDRLDDERAEPERPRLDHRPAELEASEAADQVDVQLLERGARRVDAEEVTHHPHQLQQVEVGSSRSRSSKLSGPGGLSRRHTRRSRASTQKSSPRGTTSTVVNSWMPSILVERRASSWLNHRFGSEVDREELQRLGRERPAEVRRAEVLRVEQREQVLDPRRVADELATLLGRLPRGRVDDLRDGAVARDVGRRAAHRAADREAADAERRAAAGRTRLRLRALRLVHLAAALADELAVGLAFEQLAADDARLEHAPVERLGCVEVGPGRAEVAGRVPRAQVELQVQHGTPSPRNVAARMDRSVGNEAGDTDAANLR